jgi:hypothetical protein
MDKKVILSLCRFATPKLYKKEPSAISWGRFQPKLLLHARPSAQRSMGPTGSIPRGRCATTRSRGANLLASPASRLRGHGRTLSIHPTRATSSLREGATRQRRGYGRFLLNLVRVAAKLNHGRVATTYHDWRGFGNVNRLR